MADNVSKVIDPSVVPDIGLVIEGLINIEKEIAAINGKSVSISVDLKGAESLTSLTDAITQQGQAINQLTNIQNNNSVVITQLSQVQSAYGEGINTNIKSLVEQKQELSLVSTQLKEVSKTIQDSSVVTANQSDRLVNLTKREQELKIEISSTTQALKAQVKEQFAAAGSMDDMSLKLGQLREGYRALNAEQRASPMGAKMRNDIAALDTELKNLDTSLGNNQRRVGAYGDALKNTGSLVENLGGKIQTFIVRDLLRAAAGFVVFTLLFEGVQKLYEMFTQLTDAEQLAKDRLDDYNSSLKDLQKSTADLKSNILGAIFFDESKAKSQVAILKDQNLTLSQRFLAYQALQTIAPNILDGLDKEGFKTAENTARMNAQLATLDKYIELQERISKGRENQQKELLTQQKNDNQLDAAQSKVQDLIPQSMFTRGKTVEQVQQLAANGGSVSQPMHEALDQLNKLQKEKNKLDTEAINNDKYLADLDRQKAALEGNTKDKKASTGKQASNPIEQPNLTAEYELEKQRVTQTAETQKKIADDEKENLDKRLDANTKYYFALFKLAEIERDREQAINSTKIDNAIRKQAEYQQKLKKVESDSINYKPGEQSKEIATLKQNIATEHSIIDDGNTKRTAINEKFNTELQKLTDKSQKDLGSIYLTNENDWLKKQEIAFAQREANTISGYVAQEDDLKKSLNNKQISQEDYNNAVEKLQKKEHERVRKETLAFYDQMLNDDRLTQEQHLEYQKKRNALAEQSPDKPGTVDKYLTNPIADIFMSDKIKGDLDKANEYYSEFYEHVVDLAKNAAQAITTIQDNQFAGEQQQLQIQQQKQAIASQQAIAAITAETNYAITKDDELQKQNAASNAQQNALQQEQNQLALKKAKFDKEAAEASITFNTAAGVAKDIMKWGMPDAIPFIALDIATGAAQYAAAASAPLPQFYLGGITETPVFTAGERGPELMTTPDGQSYFSEPTTTAYIAPIGTKITSASETEKLIRYASANLGISSYDVQNMQIANNDNVIREVGRMVGEKFEDVSEDMIRAMYASRPVQNVNISAENNRLQFKRK